MHKNLYIARKEQRMTQEKAEIDKYSSKERINQKKKADMISP